MSFRRTFRAALPIAIAWGVAWAVFTFLLTIYTAWRFARLGYHTSTVVAQLFQVAEGFLFGAIGGITFSALLARAERGGEVGKISYLRVAVWGALTGLCFVPPLLGLRFLLVGEGTALGVVAYMSSWFAGYGAIGALVTLAVARKGAAPAPRATAELGSDFTVAEFMEEGVRLKDSTS